MMNEKWNIKLRVLCACFVSFVASSVTHALTPSDDNHGSYITHDGNDQLTFHWEGRTGWTYFIQHSENLADWDYSGYLAPGEGNPIEFGVAMSSPDPFFLRLKLSDIPTTNAWLADFDGDSFNNQDELDMGTDPLDATDSDMDGLPDDIQALWDSIPAAWKEAFANDSNKAFYDPENNIDNIAKVLPDQDYDGDGILDMIEYIEGTDPLDYFNGEAPVLTIFWGDNQAVQPEKFSEKSLHVKVRNTEGTGYLNAPVRFEIASGDNGQLSRLKSSNSLSSTLILRTIAAGGAKAYFHAPALANGTEDSDVIVSLPNAQSVTFTLTTDSGYVIPERPPYDFHMVENSDGTYTYTWRKDNPSGAFNVREEQPIRSGNWVLLFSVDYSSLASPTDGNLYTVTVDANYNIIP